MARVLGLGQHQVAPVLVEPAVASRAEEGAAPPRAPPSFTDGEIADQQHMVFGVLEAHDDAERSPLGVGQGQRDHPRARTGEKVVAEGRPVVELIGGKCRDHDLVIDAPDKRRVSKVDEINHGLSRCGARIRRQMTTTSTHATGGRRLALVSGGGCDTASTT